MDFRQSTAGDMASSGRGRMYWPVLVGVLVAVAGTTGGVLYGRVSSMEAPVSLGDDPKVLLQDAKEELAIEEPEEERTPKDLPAASSGNVDAQFRVARWYEAQGNSKDAAFRWMRSAARGGQPQALVGLSDYYATGVGRSRDRIRGAAWFLLAVENGVVKNEADRTFFDLSPRDWTQAQSVAALFRDEVRVNFRRWLEANPTARLPGGAKGAEAVAEDLRVATG